MKRAWPGGRRPPRLADRQRGLLAPLVRRACGVLVRWVETVAVGVFVYQRTESPFIVAMMTMLRLLPMGLFGVFLGALADRMERRTALVLVVVVMLVNALVLATLAHLDMLEVWHLAVTSFINGVGWATDNPVRRVMIGEAVGSARMGTAMSIDVGANNASRMVGPAVGGLLLAGTGIEGVFALSVVLYAISAVAALRVRYRNSFPTRSSELRACAHCRRPGAGPQGPAADRHPGDHHRSTTCSAGRSPAWYR